MSDFGDARAYMHQQLGAEWELLLAEAGAMVHSESTNEEVDAAEQRAVDLVSETRQDWSLETRERVAEAWRALKGTDHPIHVAGCGCAPPRCHRRVRLTLAAHRTRAHDAFAGRVDEPARRERRHNDTSLVVAQADKQLVETTFDCLLERRLD